MELTATKYKETEVGLIPKDWHCVKMGDVGSTIIGLTYSPKDVADYGTLVLRSSNIQNNQLAYENNVFVNMDLPQRVIVKENDILICVRNGSKNLIGKCALIDEKADGYAFGAFMSIYRSEYSKYIYYSFQSNIIQKQIDETMGATINQLTNRNLFEFKIPLPPKAEQKAIAQVLSDTDALIQALEKKIAKKKHIKKGVMQKLLTPKEGWEVKSLGDFLDYEQPTNYIVENTEYNDNYDIPVLTAGKSFILGYTNEKDGIFENYPVIIFDDFTTATKYVDFPFKVKSSAMKILKPKSKDVSLGFIFEVMQQIDFPLGDHKRHWIGEFQPLEIMVPKSKDEQIHIAQTLGDMGKEISQLEQKRVKYQLAKQGMMQQLLTGKIRLI